MAYEYLKVGVANAYWNKNGTRILKYVLEMSHKGLNEQKISKIISCRPYFRRILIAEGKPPVDGKNGKVKLTSMVLKLVLFGLVI